MRDTLADTTEASRILGWRPRVTVEEGVKRLLRAGDHPVSTS
jgi:nucleoside-diphosphate-sugar epimerase